MSYVSLPHRSTVMDVVWLPCISVSWHMGSKLSWPSETSPKSFRTVCDLPAASDVRIAQARILSYQPLLGCLSVRHVI